MGPAFKVWRNSRFAMVPTGKGGVWQHQMENTHAGVNEYVLQNKALGRNVRKSKRGSTGTGERWMERLLACVEQEQ